MSFLIFSHFYDCNGKKSLFSITKNDLGTRKSIKGGKRRFCKIYVNIEKRTAQSIEIVPRGGPHQHTAPKIGVRL